MIRSREPEIMDDPALEIRKHLWALEGLERINRLSGSAGIVWPPIRELAHQAKSSLWVLDIATGAGDVPIGLWRRARQARISLRIDGCDRNLRSVEYARERARTAKAEVSFFPMDALEEPIPAGYDVLLSSLFLHHLDEQPTIALLRKMAAAAKQMVVINDLVRSNAGFAVASLGTRLITSSEVVHIDGPRSVRAAYTLSEIREMLFQAGCEGGTVAWRWPFRFLAVWRKR